MEILSDGRKEVYKRIPKAVFDMIHIMETYDIHNMSKNIKNKLCEYDYIVIHKNFDGNYDVKKYNGLGNLFEFNLHSWGIYCGFSYDWLENYSKSKITFKTHSSFKKFLNRYQNNENVFFEESKYEMLMSKHNINFNEDTVFQSH